MRNLPLVFLAASLLSGYPLPGQSQEVALNIKLNRLSDLSDTAISRVIDEMNSIMESTSIPCALTFRVGSIDRLASIPAKLDSEEQLRKLLQLKENSIAVVEYLNFCDKFNPAIAGCAGRGSSVVAESQGASSNARIRRNALIWLHEIGHSQGLMAQLTPQKAHSTQVGALMFPRIDPDNSELSQNECSLMRDDKNLAFVQSDPVERVFAAQADSVVSEVDQVGGSQVEKILQSQWDGIPFAELSALKHEVDMVRIILLDHSRRDLWANGVLALGVLGDNSDVDFMMWYYSYLSSAEHDAAVADAQVNLPIGLGILSASFSSTEGRDFLSKLISPDVVQGDLVVDGELGDVAASQLSQNAAIGMAIGPASEVQIPGFGGVIDQTNDLTGLSSPEAAEISNNFGPDFLDSLGDIRNTVQNTGLESAFGAFE